MHQFYFSGSLLKARMQAADYIEFLVKVSIVEIYNERRNTDLGQTNAN